MTPTRSTFAGLETWEIVFWYGLIALSTAVFAWGVVRLVLKYRRGRGPLRFDRPWTRLRRAATVVFTHSWIKRRDPLAGAGHFLIFYGFVVLFLGTVILAFQDDVAKPILGWHFFRNGFYEAYSLFLDVFGVALVVGLAIMAYKRGIQKPFRLSYRRPDRTESETERRAYVIGDWTFLGILFFLALTGFLLEAFRIAESNPSFEVWSPLGWAAGHALRGIGVSGEAASTAHFVQWWVHGVVALGFVASIPFTKAVHMLTSPASVATREERAAQELVPIPAGAKPDEVGFGTILDFPARYLLQFDACTKCGKCHAACPATNSGYPLSPRDLILDLREVAEGALGLRRELGIPPLHDPAASVLGDPIRPETLWSCMQCMACVEICPVGIEHVPIINGMRRRLVEQGEMDSSLQQTLESIYETGNSFGETGRKRARWTRALDFEVKDIRKEPAEILWFVGDYASFDPRNQLVTQTLARVLQHAGVDFGILYDAEHNAGCDVRRVGEEGLFNHLREQNVATISRCTFDRILTWDPHSFHTLRNEYPTFGVDWEVVHHSQLLLELIEAGRLAPSKTLDYRVTYHDPCTLGRYNGVYDEPRRVLAAIGTELVEMPRSRDNSFCCGAGGGRIWMSELKREDAPRPSEQRIDEAVALGNVDHFVVCCPKDVTMYEDAIKTSGHQGDIELRELTELVWESLDLPALVAAATHEREEEQA
ncbi:MAG: 4Fe-4S dicluster domain-containing protein [Actinobacteria bacterium]|nr:MAG: 4Fe-4S dicluster domain-containing protein [Actinomycetota bacterium]